MKLDLVTLQGLVEKGDLTSIENYIKGTALEKTDILPLVEKTDVYSLLQKGDIKAAALVNQEVLSELNSEKDIHYNTAFSTFQQKKLPELLNQAKQEVLSSQGQQETPEQKEIRELRERLDNQLEQNAKVSLREDLLKYATSDEVKLQSSFISKYLDRFIPGSIPKKEDGSFDLETIKNEATENLKGLATDFNAVISSQIEEKMKSAQRGQLPGGTGAGSGGGELSYGQKLAMQNNHESTQKKLDSFFS